MNNTHRENGTMAGPLIFTVPAYGFVMALYLDCLGRTPTREPVSANMRATHKETQIRSRVAGAIVRTLKPIHRLFGPSRRFTRDIRQHCSCPVPQRKSPGPPGESRARTVFEIDFELGLGLIKRILLCRLPVSLQVRLS